MQPDRPLLTIAIPTYNRSRNLEQLLGSLMPQALSEGRVEVLVSDNCSTDDTPAVVARFRQAGWDLVSIRNEVNIGADANFLQCFEKGSGKYVWIFGDDDFIAPGGLAKVVALLADNDYSLAYVSPYGFTGDYIPQNLPDKLGRTAEKLPDGLELARRAGTMIAFISAMIVNKNHYYANQRQDLRTFVGTNLLQLGFICPLLGCDAPTLFIWDKLVAGRAGNSSGWGVCEIFGVKLERILKATLAGRPDVAAQLRNFSLRAWFPDRIIEIRKGTAGVLVKEDFRSVLEPMYKNNWRYWACVYPLTMLPLGAARVWYASLRFVNRVLRTTSALINITVHPGTFVKAAE